VALKRDGAPSDPSCVGLSGLHSAAIRLAHQSLAVRRAL